MLNKKRTSSVTKRSCKLAPISGQKGQISIFFSASLVVLITIIAFVINVGLFVKAKINLQNATDAAAFSGAAVQSRQLTTIAYLNWEMRNIYKEWMFKYYVAGNLNIESVENPSAIPGDAVSYRLRQSEDVINGKTYADPYNFPSVCIHIAGSKTNLCKRYSVPGLPEFGSSNLPGAEEASRAFMDALISTKVLDCVAQTKLNMLVNLTWAYNVLSIDSETIVDQGPQILADKQGAWPKAVEVAMRIRNLEKAVNRPAETTGVCASKGNQTKISCGKDIGEIGTQKLAGNERIMKAFYSGYRNIGNLIDNEMKDTFTLTEIPPKEADLGNQRSASYLLVPEEKIAAYKKQYLDLQLQMVNYATFYNAFVPRSTSPPETRTAISGACDVTKVAMPVPGYPMGYYKNPDIVTYYAVRGEAEFVGMFNPFADSTVKLTAYSAAKPFGGRIGPMLFYQAPNSDFFVGRTDTGKYRSVPYIASLDFVGTNNVQTNLPLKIDEFSPGTPLPINFSNEYFWLKDQDSPIGGYIDDVHFGLPNLVYDYQTPFSSDGYTIATEKINVIKTVDADRPIGLFSKFQLQQFKGDALNENVSQEILERELKRIKAPTLYETANYLVPTPEQLNQEKNLDSIGMIPGLGPQVEGTDLKNYQATIYAPLYSQDQEDVFWKNGDEVVTTLFEFLRKQESGIQKYKRNMIQAAMTIREQGNNLPTESQGAKPGFDRAAEGVADIDFALGPNQPIKSCDSIAGTFLFFYFGDSALDRSIVTNPANCPQTLGANLRKYFAEVGTTTGFSPSHYSMDYSYNPKMQRGTDALYTAYMPGSYTGVDGDGVFRNPIPGSNVDDETMRRNFYSTKFVQLGSLQQSGPWNETTSNFNIYSEGNVQTSGTLNRAQKNYRNPLDAQAIGADINAIRY